MEWGIDVCAILRTGFEPRRESVLLAEGIHLLLRLGTWAKIALVQSKNESDTRSGVQQFLRSRLPLDGSSEGFRPGDIADDHSTVCLRDVRLEELTLEV